MTSKSSGTPYLSQCEGAPPADQVPVLPRGVRLLQLGQRGHRAPLAGLEGGQVQLRQSEMSIQGIQVT